MSHEEIYNKFKEALLKTTTKEHREKIMELKFGCKLADKETGVIFDVYQAIGQHRFGGGYLRTELGDIDYEDFYQTKRYKVFGRPITLEDVLRVLDKKGKSIFPFTNGSFWTITNLMEPAFSLGYKWLLGLPADKQTDETLIELTRLLQN